MTVYEGIRQQGGVQVYVQDETGRRPLPLSLNVRNHSPTGFEWGYRGSGPAQLALAMCLDALEGDETRALAVYQTFKDAVVARMPNDGWIMPRQGVVNIIRHLED